MFSHGFAMVSQLMVTKAVSRIFAEKERLAEKKAQEVPVVFFFGMAAWQKVLSRMQRIILYMWIESTKVFLCSLGGCQKAMLDDELRHFMTLSELMSFRHFHMSFSDKVGSARIPLVHHHFPS